MRGLAKAILLWTFAASPSAPADAGPSDEMRRGSVEGLLAPYRSSNAPGCAVGVLRGGQDVLETAAGSADGMRPLTGRTPIYLASVAKQFTAAAVYRLAAQRRIAIDEPIGKSLPELTGVTARPTVRQLLNHTSGLRDWNALQEVAGRLSQHPDNNGIVRILNSQTALNFEPGTDYEYSNSDYVLLSMLVERVGGESLASFTRGAFFGPLRMEHSSFGRVEGGEPLALGFEIRDGAPRPAEPPVSIGDGGMYGSVADLLRWMGELQRHRRSRTDPLGQIQSRARLKSGEAIPHASGLYWGRYNGHLTLSHNGAVSGFQADVVQFPDDHLSVVCLCNRGDVDAASLSRKIADLYLRPARQAAALPANRRRRTPAADLAGLWQSPQGFLLSIKIVEDRLVVTLAGQSHEMTEAANPGEFGGQEGAFRLVLRRHGSDAVQFGWEGDRPNLFRSLASGTPLTGVPSAYTGRFRNDDMGIVWNLVVNNGDLLITNDAGWRIPLGRRAENLFEVGPYLLEFDGDRTFRLHRERLWNLVFRREV